MAERSSDDVRASVSVDVRHRLRNERCDLEGLGDFEVPRMNHQIATVGRENAVVVRSEHGFATCAEHAEGSVPIRK